eukprot:3800987-Pleurochrysis_carterae.AAC.1
MTMCTYAQYVNYYRIRGFTPLLAHAACDGVTHAHSDGESWRASSHTPHAPNTIKSNTHVRPRH